MPPPTLLLIDDHPHVLQHRKQILEKSGFSVLTASTATSAMSILENVPVGVVLLEYRFEGIDAEAVAYLVKKRYPGQFILLLSAYAAMPERILWLVDDYVMRSDPLEILVNKIAELSRPDQKPAAACDKPSSGDRFVA